MSTQSLISPATAGAARRPFVERLHLWVATVDHKRLGLLYIFYALLFLVFGGVEATIMRIQLIRPLNTFVSPEVFNQMFTMHGTTMIFFFAMPIMFGFANYLVPLMIGARDMAFPRLNAFSFWMTAFGGLLLYFSFVGGDGLYGAGGAPDVGWFAYAPLTAKTFSQGHSTDFWILALFISGIGSVGTAINIIATIICMRCKGMALGKMPLLAWLMLTMAGLVILAVSPLTAAQLMLLVDRYLGGHFFDTQAGGSAVIWMHFFWVFGHPEVYVLVVPAFAFASEIIPVFSRKAIFGYPIMVAATLCIGFISVSVWAHHMFTVGMSATANGFFVLSTMAIAVPTGIKIFNWLATMWGGHIEFKAPMLFCVAFLFQFLIAGLTGVMQGRRSLRLATERVVFRGRPLSLCDRWRHSLHAVRGFSTIGFLKCPDECTASVFGRLRFFGSFLSVFILHSISCIFRASWNASEDLHLRTRPWLGHMESHRDGRRLFSGGRGYGVPRESDLVLLSRRNCRNRSVGRMDPRMVDFVASAGVQL